MLYKEFKVKYKETEDGSGYLEGYASTFIKKPDAYGDIVKKGAFTNTLKRIYEEGKSIPLLWSHKMDDLKSYIGTAEADEDDKGLHFIAKFDDTDEAQKVRQMYKDGRLSKFSFAYDIIDEGTITLEDGTKANELRELELFEISCVLVPANSDAGVIDVKSNDNVKKDNVKADEVTIDKEVLNEFISLLNQAIDKVTKYISDGESNSEDSSEVNDEQSEEQKNIVNEVKSTEEQKKLLDIINNI